MDLYLVVIDKCILFRHQDIKFIYYEKLESGGRYKFNLFDIPKQGYQYIPSSSHLAIAYGSSYIVNFDFSGEYDYIYLKLCGVCEDIIREHRIDKIIRL